MPFVLYDKVTIDQTAFACLIGEKPSLEGWRPSSASVAILQHLASDGHIILDDYVSRLSSPAIAELVDELNVLDLSDPNILTPAVESLRLWIQFYRDLFGATDTGLGRFHDAISALTEPRRPKKTALGYLYECVSDINRVLVLSQELQQPIYEWEDYCRYYRYKFLRIARLVPERPMGQTLGQLFDVFIPNFSIQTYDELLDIRHDHRLAAVRRLVDDLGDNPVDKDLVIQANEDVLRIKRRLDTFSRYVGYAGYPLSLFLGVFSNALEDIANSVAKRWFERNVKWQMFFVERALEYKDRQVEDALRRQTKQ